MVRQRIVLYLLLMILVSCQYGLPGDKYFKDVKKTTPNAVVTLANYNNNDTIYIYQATQFQFAVTDANVTKTEVIMGSTTLASFNDSKGWFYLDYNNWIVGTTTLKIQFTANSGTGSLADHLGAETVTLWRSWVLIVDIGPPPPPTLTVSNVNGFLKLSWTPFKKPSFSEYILDPGHNTKSGRSIIIKDANASSYIDSSYVAGQNNYSVTTVTVTGQASYSSVVVNHPQAATYTYHAADSTVKLVWRKSPYQSAFKNAVITENGNVVTTITSGADTTYSFHLASAAFGSSSSVLLTFNANYPYPAYTPFSFTASITNPTGASHILASQGYYNQPAYFYSQALNTLVAHNALDNYMRVYNSAMKVTDSILFRGLFMLPYPGKYAYYSDGSWLGNSLVQLDLTNGATKTYGAGGGFGNGFIGKMSASANGFVSYDLEDPVHGNSSASLININSSTVIQNNLFSLSDDGRYASNGALIFPYNGSQFTGAIFEPISDGKFRPDNTDELVSAASPTVIVKTTDGSILRTITPPDNSYTWKSYDPPTHMLLYTKAGSYKSYLIDIDTNAVKTINGTGVAFINGTLIDSYGNYIKLL